jgi:DNA primase catalytic core
MARIPEDELERLKREISVQRLAEARGVELRRHGQDLLGLCPFHDDHEPSLVISPVKNLWHCLGACQAGGSVIDWVMRAEGVSFRHAVEILRADVPSLAATSGPPRNGKVVRKTTVQKLPSLLEREAEDAELLLQVVAYYHEELKETPKALAYLQGRGLDHPEMIEHFKLGFADRTLGYRLPQKNRKEGASIRGRLQELGVFRRSGHEHFRGSIVIPVFTPTGQVAEMYGRKINDNLRKGTPMHLYLPGPHAGVWNEVALGASREIILCESLIDALTFWCAGYRNVTASYGTKGFTDEHLSAFERHGTERVLIAYDRDQAGDEAAAVVAKRLAAKGMEVLRVQLPRGMDVNEYAQKVTPREQSLGVVLRSAVWMAGTSSGSETRDPRPGNREPRDEIRDPGDEGREPGMSGVDGMTGGDEQHGQELPGSPGLAEGDGPGAAGLPPGAQAPIGGEVRAGLADPPSRGVDPGEHRGGERQASPQGVPPAPVDRPGQPGGAGHPSPGGPAPGLPGPGGPPADRGGDAGREDAPPGSDPVPEPVASGSRVSDPGSHPATERSEHQVTFTFGDRRYRIRGLAKNLSFDVLKVNVMVAVGEQYHVDTLDLYMARQRATFTKQAVEELRVGEEVIRKDLGHVLRQLEQLQEEAIHKALGKKQEEKAVVLTEAQRTEALALLRDPNLLHRILTDFDRCGMVGEETNKLVGYLAAVSRKLEEPLAILVQSTSAAGKSALLEAVLALVPVEERVKYSALTGQALYYLGEKDLKHRILALVEEEGAERAAYALKLLQSEGELCIASTGKDPTTGRMETHEYRVEGPVMLFLTTTSVEVDEELLNRCLVLTIDEDRRQTRAIHEIQRRRQTLEGLLARQDREAILRVHRNAQRLLRPLLVANPFARHLTFLDDRTRMRRDHVKYLTLIRSVALLHQYQRPVKTTMHRGRRVPYIEVTLDDIVVANQLAHEVLGRTLDELPPQTRRLLLLLEEMVSAGCRARGTDRTSFRFSRRQVREHTGWSDSQVRTHLGRLVELEYVLVHRGGRGQSFEYELLYDGGGGDGKPFLMGLVDPARLTTLQGQQYDSEFEGSGGEVEGGVTPRLPPDESLVRTGGSSASPGDNGTSGVPRGPDQTPLYRTAAKEETDTVLVAAGPEASSRIPAPGSRVSDLGSRIPAPGSRVSG